MSLFQMFSAFDKYSLDVLFLALAVVIVTSFIKKTVLRNKYKKIVTFVPFAVGVAAYILYMYILTKIPILKLLNYQNIKSGIITGGLGTVYYVFYEQFIREKKLPLTVDVQSLAVEGIISAIVVKEKVAQTAQEIAAKIKDKLYDKGYCTGIITDAVTGKLIQGTSQQDIIIYSKLIITTLSAL